MSNYSFYLRIYPYYEDKETFTEHLINPNYKSLNKKFTKESNQEFFRETLDGKILLHDEDFELIRNATIDSKFTFHIKNSDNTEYFKGEFFKTDCKIDYSKRSCEIKITPLDQYTSILEKYKNTYDLIKLAPAISEITVTKRPIIQLYILGGNTMSNHIGGAYWEEDVTTVVDNADELMGTYHFSLCEHITELRIEGAAVESVNGMYSGQQGILKNGKCTMELKATYLDDVTFGCLLNVTIKNENGEPVYYGTANIYPSCVNVPADTITGPFDNLDVYYLSHDKFVDFDFEIESVDKTEKFTINKDTVFAYHIYSRLITDVDTVQGLSTYDIPLEDISIDNRNFKKCLGIELPVGSIVGSCSTSEEPTEFGQNDYKEYFTNDGLKALYDFTLPVPLCRSTWVNTSIWAKISSTEIGITGVNSEANKQYILKDSFSIGATIKSILKKIAPELTHEETSEYSQFLYSDINPITKDSFKVHISQKTNILKGEYDQAAKKAEISFKELMEMLRDCFRCYWYIEDNKFKIEHIYYFNSGKTYKPSYLTQLDITSLKDKFNKVKISYFQNSVEFDKSQLASRYEYNWMDDATEAFSGISLDVKANYIQKDKTEQINISKFSSDVDMMLHHSDNFSNDGFALLCPIVKSDGSLILPISAKIELVDKSNYPYYVSAQNYFASFAYLVKFYMWDIPANNLSCNAPVQAESLKPCMTHEIQLFLENDPNLLKFIKTPFGYGKIDEANINIENRIAKIKLLYEPV